MVSMGEVDPTKFPILKTKLLLEFLRDHLHVKSRTNTIVAIPRIRNALGFATHLFFYEHIFLYVHTPILTAGDCEGVSEMFQAMTLISESEELDKELIKNPPPSEVDIEAQPRQTGKKPLTEEKIERKSVGCIRRFPSAVSFQL